jgi:hypothetical protein
MRFSEFQNDLHHFKVTVRVKNDSGSMTVKTMVSAESMAQAQFLMRHVFGKDAVVSIAQLPMHEDMSEGTKTLSPQELQVKSLADQAKRLSQQAKAMKSRQKIAKAQKELRSIV